MTKTNTRFPGVSCSTCGEPFHGLTPCATLVPETKWTPGPWRYDPKDHTIACKVNHDFWSEGVIASVADTCAETPAELEANARLIAAAPTLYEALERITQIAGNLPDDRLTNRTGPNDAAARGLMVCEARRIARAALDAVRKEAK